MSLRSGAALLLAAAAACLSAPARAQAALDAHGPRVLSGFQALDRPTGMVEAGFGWLTLPGAAVCSQAGCKEGDTSFVVDAWQLYRQNLRLAFGAGLLFGLIPTTDAPRGDPQGVQRNHSRRYLTLEGTLRYYPYVGESVELWLGLTGGLAVVSDRFEVESSEDKSLVGSSGVTIRTEGGTLGLAVGGAFQLSQSWSLGSSLRFGNWFLPDEPATGSLGDEASLAGRNSVFSLGLNLAYRIGL